MKVKAPAVNLSYLQPLALHGTPLSSKSSVQHIQTSLTYTGPKNHDLIISDSPILRAVNVDDYICHIKACFPPVLLHAILQSHKVLGTET